MTRFGMIETDFGELSQLMADVILHGKDIKEEVRNFRQRFPDIQYCFSGEEFEDLMQPLHKLI